MSAAYIKRPDERLDYIVDFSRWMSTGDLINSVAASIVSTSPDANTVPTAAIDSTSFSSNTATAWLINGVDGETVDLTIQIVTAMGRKKDGTLRIRIRSNG